MGHVRGIPLVGPAGELRELALDAIGTQAQRASGEAPDRRPQLLGQLGRLQDLYVMGDLPKRQYVIRRHAIEEELRRLGLEWTPSDGHLDLPS